jgi:hypothetical protein
LLRDALGGKYPRREVAIAAPLPKHHNSGTLTNFLHRSVVRRVPERMNCFKRGKLEYHQWTSIVMAFENLDLSELSGEDREVATTYWPYVGRATEPPGPTPHNGSWCIP